MKKKENESNVYTSIKSFTYLITIRAFTALRNVSTL